MMVVVGLWGKLYILREQPYIFFPSYWFYFQFDFLFGLLIKQPSTHRGSYSLLFNLVVINVMVLLINADLIIKHSYIG